MVSTPQRDEPAPGAARAAERAPTPAPARASGRPAFWLALAPLLALAWRFDFLVDDAFITFRYAQHLAAGLGPVFNPDEVPVEGYTNPLWMVAMAGVQGLGLDPALWSRALSTAAAVLLLALVVHTLPAGTNPGETAARRLGALAFATLPPVAVWSTGGLETMPFALCTFATFERLTDPRGPRTAQAGLAGALAVLLRADGFVWVALALAAALVRTPERRAACLGAGLAAALVLGLHVLWRRGYYGAWGPNTARAKVHLDALSLERGALYVVSLLLAVLSVPLALALGLVGLARGAGPVRRRAAAGLAFFAGASAYLTLVGGDWMMMFRQLVPAMPFVALALAAGLASLRSGAARVALGALAVALSLLPSFDLHPVPQAVRTAAHFRWGPDQELSEYEMWARGVRDIEEWTLMGRALGEHLRPGDSYVLGNIGAIPFYSGVAVHDTLGLTNREPFAPVVPGARHMPGHDRVVEIATFDRYRPTIRGVDLTSDPDPTAGMPAHWFTPGSPMYGRVEVEVIPLDDFPGAGPGTYLKVARNRW